MADCNIMEKFVHGILADYPHFDGNGKMIKEVAVSFIGDAVKMTTYNPTDYKVVALMIFLCLDCFQSTQFKTFQF